MVSEQASFCAGLPAPTWHLLGHTQGERAAGECSCVHYSVYLYVPPYCCNERSGCVSLCGNTATTCARVCCACGGGGVSMMHPYLSMCVHGSCASIAAR